MTKLQGAIASFLLILGLLMPMSFANAEDETTLEDVGDTFKTCVGDYYSFVFTVRNEEMRRAYFTDMFTLSWCQINDVLPLYEEYESLKEQFWADVSNCRTVEDYEANIATYKKEMKRNLLEVYFIRHVRSTARNNEELQTADDRIEDILDVLKKEMEAKFVDEEEMVSQEDLDEMFENWKSKYSDTIGQYTTCNEGPIWELYESWFSFIETLESLDISIDAPERQSFMDVITPEVDDEGWHEGVQDVVDAFSKYEDNTSNAEEEKELEEAEEEEEEFPRSFSAYMDQFLEEATDKDVFESSTARMAEYELLYGEVGAVSTTNIVILLDQFNEVVINNNIQDFPAIRESLDEIYGKQCPN